MIKLFALCLVSAILFTPNAFAKCTAGHKTIFSCTTAKGKLIEVCDAGKTITYSFGSPQTTPEIALNVPRDKATTFQWAGVGRYLSYSVDIPNGTTTYSVFSSMDRITEAHAMDAGVNVWEGEKLLATVKCSGKKMVNNLEGVDLSPTP
ncbi:MAG: hypothetical protein ABL923_14500 [Burkholderiaceae bacterium]